MVRSIIVLVEYIDINSRILGVLTQFAIVMGIMVTQAMGLKLATPHEWRVVLLFSFSLAAAMLLASPLIVESPIYLARHGRAEEKALATRWLWGIADSGIGSTGRMNVSQCDKHSLLLQLLMTQLWTHSLATRTLMPRSSVPEVQATSVPLPSRSSLDPGSFGGR